MKWGIGLKLIFITVNYAILVSLLSWHEGNYLQINFNSLNFKIGVFLLVLGFYFYISILKKIKRAFKRRIFLKEGAYRVVRHPIYSIWAFLLIPAITLIVNNKYFYSLPLFFIIMLIILIPREEKEVIDKFDKKYIEYKKNVPLIFPSFDSIYGFLFYPEFSRVLKSELYIIRERYANFFIYKKGNSYIAVDSGLGTKRGRQEMEKFGIPLGKVKAVFFTHSDYDHIDGRKFFFNADLYFCEREELIFQGKKPRFLKIIREKNRIDRYEMIKEEETIIIDGIKITPIKTPGHTPGHCTYIIDDKYITTGDLLRIKEGKIIPFYKILSFDYKLQLKSFEKIKKYLKKYTVLTAHHGIITKNSV